MTTENPLRIAVIGVGSLGQHHARILSDLPGTSLTGVVDTNQDRAREIAGKYGAPFFTDYGSLPEVDAVVIAAPTRLHTELAAHFLEKGIGVLCEKPMATTVEECETILAARDRSQTPLLVGHIEHFNPGVEALSKHVERPGFLEVHRLGVFVPRSLDVDVVLDLMIHDIEIAQSLVKKAVARVEAVGVRVLTPYVDLCNARLTFEGGCVANLTASRISREKVRKLRLFQSAAYLSVDYGEQAVEYFRVDESGGARNIIRVPVPVGKKEPLRCELEHFVRVLKSEESPKVSGEAARDAVATAQSILACIAT